MAMTAMSWIAAGMAEMRREGGMAAAAVVIVVARIGQGLSW